MPSLEIICYVPLSHGNDIKSINRFYMRIVLIRMCCLGSLRQDDGSQGGESFWGCNSGASRSVSLQEALSRIKSKHWNKVLVESGN